MKAILASLAMALAAASVCAADTPSLTGKWKVHSSIVGTETDQDCAFTQKDKDLTGTCSVEQGSVQVTGKIGDSNITWEFKTEYQGSLLTLTFTGALDKDSKIVGTVEVEPMSVQGDFTATQSK